MYLRPVTDLGWESTYPWLGWAPCWLTSPGFTGTTLECSWLPGQLKYWLMGTHTQNEVKHPTPGLVSHLRESTEGRPGLSVQFRTQG